MTSSHIPTAPIHQPHPGAGPDAALRALLDEVASCLSELKWEPPTTLADGGKVLADLAHTRDRLARVGRDPRLSAVGVTRDLSTIVNKLALATGGWTPRLLEHAATGQDLAPDTAHALAAELREIAQAGGLVLDRVEALLDGRHQPVPGAAEWAKQPTTPASPTPHRRTGIQTKPRRGPSPAALVEPASDEDPGAVSVLVRALYQHRIIGFSVAAGVAALALVALYYATAPAQAHIEPSASRPGAGNPRPSASPQSGGSTATSRASVSTRATGVSTVAAGAGVAVLQIALLSGSTTQQRVDALVSVQTSTTVPVTLQISYWGQRAAGRVGQSWYSTVLSGGRAYQVPIGIPTGSYCGDVLTVTASAGGQYAAQNTSPGC